MHQKRVQARHWDGSAFYSQDGDGVRMERRTLRRNGEVWSMAVIDSNIKATILDIGGGGVSFVCPGGVLRKGEERQLDLVFMDRDLLLRGLRCEIVNETVYGITDSGVETNMHRYSARFKQMAGDQAQLVRQAMT